MREREPLNWSIPLPGTILGVGVRIHILFVCVALGVILWVATSRDFASGQQMWVHAAAVMAMLFVAVLVHEFGHLIGARRVGGDAMELLIWPLGGLTEPDLPQSPGAHFWTAIYGPAMNFALAICTGTALVALGFIPPLNPFASPFNPRMENWQNGVTYFSIANPGQAEYWYYTDRETDRKQTVKLTFDQAEDGPRLPKPGTPVLDQKKSGSGEYWLEEPNVQLKPARLGAWHILLAQFFSVNALLFWVNLLPAFPLDGGKLLQCWLWHRGERRQATATAAYVGFLVMLAVGVYAIAVNDLLPAILAVMIYVRCRQQLIELEESEDEPSPLGYDFSQGYTSLERPEEGDPPPPPPPKRGWFRRMLDRRAEQRRQREEQRRIEEEHRLDELLEKIHGHGKQALSDDEVRFLTRMSSRYPNRKES